ncbi:hypothetical protein ZIOFF_036799 [Zingiber officinale]|uniref:Phytocyanin domain-containing protein n=1 Tax=Zingiber officinale TaxID=94328 RepID=A0A8J5GE49_ZINOF|nr:hypothetical protein ZIOFF_036799 [Zingiber officinale]
MAIAALPSVWVVIVASLLLPSTVSALKFRVGGEKGWTEPNGDAAENYNHWASHNRFRVGDSLYFRYENDSLLEVTKDDYKRCYTANPLRKFASGITTVALDRSGLFFFISEEDELFQSHLHLLFGLEEENSLPPPPISPLGVLAALSLLFEFEEEENSSSTLRDCSFSEPATRLFSLFRLEEENRLPSSNAMATSPSIPNSNLSNFILSVSTSLG